MSSDLLFITAYQIEARHSFLEALLGKVKPEETESLETARTLVINTTTCLCVFSLMGFDKFFYHKMKFCCKNLIFMRNLNYA